MRRSDARLGRDRVLASNVVALAVVALLQCGSGCAVERGAVGLALGAVCGPATACVEGLLCIDGLCAVRPWPPDAAQAQDTVTPIDLGVPAPDTAVADALADADAADDVADAGDGGEAETDSGASTRVIVGDHTGADAPSDDAVTLQVDQAAVAELVSPAAGTLATLEIIAVEPPGGPSCGVFHVLYWAPDEAGKFAVEPSWYGPALALVGSDATQELLVVDGPAVAVGAFRVGLVFTGVCPTTPRQPRVVIDDSGIVTGTFIWARVGASATFISGTTLGLAGRWAMRAGVDVSSR